MDALKDKQVHGALVRELSVYAELTLGNWNRTVIRTALDGVLSFGTQTGHYRKRNEDRFLISQFKSGDDWLSMSAICDGVGGSKRGDEAAAMTLSAIFLFLVRTGEQSTPKKIELAIRFADDYVRSTLNGEGASTLSMLIGESSGRCFIANVGDSRIYEWLPGDALSQLTVDDTIENELRNMAVRDPSLIDARGMRGQLTQAIGEKGRQSESLRADVLEIQVRSAHGVVLGTDGLWKVSEQAFNAIAHHAPDSREFAKRSLTFANWVGGVDNASVIAISDLRTFLTTPWLGPQQSCLSISWMLDGKIVDYENKLPVQEKASHFDTTVSDLFSEENRLKAETPKRGSKRKRASKKSDAEVEKRNQLRLIGVIPSLEITSDDDNTEKD